MMNLDSPIYIAGHRGLVGSAILRRLKSKGYMNLIVRTRQEADLTDTAQVRNLFESTSIEYVFLAAAKVGGIMANSTHQGDFIYENLAIALNVIRAAKDYGVRKLLNLGSSCIYPRQAPQPIKEEYLMSGPLEPTNEGYAIAKIAALKMCRYFNEQYGTDFLSVMPTNLYGPGDSYDLENSHVLPAMIRKFHLGKMLVTGNREAIRHDIARFSRNSASLIDADIDSMLKRHGITLNKITFWGSGMPRREFLYVDDLAAACVHLMERHHSTEIGEVINIGTGEDISIQSLAELIGEIVDYSGEIRWDVTKPDGMPRKLLDVSPIHNLGWRPTVDLREGIRRSYEWFCSLTSDR